MAGSRLSGMKFVSLIEIAALGSGPLNKSYKCRVSPVSWTPHTPNQPSVLANPIQLLSADVSVYKAVCIALSSGLNTRIHLVKFRISKSV